MTEISSTIDWVVEQRKDNNLCKVIDLIENGVFVKSEWLKIINGNRFLSVSNNLNMRNGVLMHNNQIVCPSKLKDEIMLVHHDLPCSGHRSADTTVKSIKYKYNFWLNLATDVENYCKSCHKCQTFNYGNLNQVAPLNPIVVKRPLQIMGPLKASRKGN